MANGGRRGAFPPYGLEGTADLTLPHVAEAVQYRSLDRQFSSPQGVQFAKETAERYLV